MMTRFQKNQRNIKNQEIKEKVKFIDKIISSIRIIIKTGKKTTIEIHIFQIIEITLQIIEVILASEKIKVTTLTTKT